MENFNSAFLVLKMNQKDRSVYLDLFRHGASAASSISARTQIERTTVYSVLKKLMQYGFIVKTSKQGTAYFAALDPMVLKEKTERNLKQKEQDVEKVKWLANMLQEIKYKESDMPDIKIFEGREGIISLYEIMLRSGLMQHAFLTVEQLPDGFAEYLKNDYIRQKRKLNVFSKVLVCDSEKARQYQRLDSTSNRETRIIKKSITSFETEIIVGEKDLMGIINFGKECIGVLIKSRPINRTLKTIFNLLWELAGR